MWIKREIYEFIRTEHALRPALLLTGGRQAGKTSLLEHAFPQHNFVSLDLPRIAEEAEHSGEQFLARHPAPVIIDEIQYAPGLFRYLKNDIDRQREVNGRFLLTGSQKLALMKGVGESLAGRISVVELYTLSLKEIENFEAKPLNRTRVLHWMFTGGYPELVAKGLSPHRFYADYVATYLERDVRQLLDVRNLRDFDRFLRLCAVRNAQLLSMNAIAADIGISTNTVKSWLAVLETSGIVKLLEPYYRNLGKRLVKTPKLYFLDTGLACFLAGIETPEVLLNSALCGPMFEGLVLGQIVRYYANRGMATPVYFYRDHYGNEVDFIIASGEKLRLIEVKWAENLRSVPRGFQEIEKLIGEENILGRTIITPTRGARRSGNLVIDDPIDLTSLSE